MNSLIVSLNMWGGRLADFALPILWQSSLLIAVVFVVEVLLRRKVRAAVRYSLWFVVFVKLLLPPTLALPTGAAWWLRSRPVPLVASHLRVVTVNYSDPVDDYVPAPMPAAPVAPPAPALSREGWMLLVASAVGLLLTLWVLVRWRQIARCVQRTTEPGVDLGELLAEAGRLAGLRRDVTLRVTAEAMSPAVCGLFRPVILLPQSLIEKLTPSQLRAVLLHELIHLRRRDVWVNCAQTLLQIVYWWHPLLWVANARMRRVREEAVDDAVMCALSAEAEVYAPTLLEVAKLAFARPLASLGLVGILESRSALRHRIERLLNFTTPRRAGVSMVSVICLLAFTALAVPMGEPPARPSPGGADELATEKLISYRAKVDSEVFVRNIRARAGGTMHTTNDDLNEILVAIMDGFNVDCTGERAIQFNQATGEVTAKNTSEALGVLDEVVKELNLKGGEHVLNPPQGLKDVLIEGQFYLLKRDEAAKLQLASQALHRDGELSPWGELSPTDLANVRQQLKGLGFKPLMSPRVQTAHGIMASMSMSDGTNKIQLECVPYVHEGMVNLTVLARTTGEYAPMGKIWPDIAGHTNCAIFSKVATADGGGVILSAAPVGTDGQLLILLNANVVQKLLLTGELPLPRRAFSNQSEHANSPMPATTDNVPILGDLPGVGPFFRSSPNATPAPKNAMTFYFHMDPAAFQQRLAEFAAAHKLEGTTNHAVLVKSLLADAGVNTYPATSFLLHETPERADLALHATKEDLRKAAEALGLNWETEPALNESASSEVGGLRVGEAPPPAAGAGTTYYKIDTNNPAAQSSARVVSQLVQDGKLLYQVGRVDEAESKLQEALVWDPNNQAALYYLNLVKQVRVRQRADARNATNSPWRKLPAPNLNARTNMIFTSAARQRIYEKLNNIRFDKIAFADMTLREVVPVLTELATRRDPDQEGVNFMIGRPSPGQSSQTGEAATFDPTTGQPISQAPPDFDIGSVKINLDPALQNVRLLDVLQAITQNSDHPIKYSIVDYGIEFSLKTPGDDLHTRVYLVDAVAFFRKFSATNTNPPSTSGNNHGLRYVTGHDPEGDAEIQSTLANFFHTIGVNLTAQKSAFFNDHQGTLTVHATDDDLELVQRALNAFSAETSDIPVTTSDAERIPPIPQVTVKARFVETDKQFLEMLSTNGVGTPTNNSQNRILTEAQFRPLLKMLEKRDHADLLNEGEVTTLSGRQANFQVMDVITIVCSATNKTPPFDTTTSPFGTTVDVIARAAADNRTMDLKAIPSVTEFLGYEDVKTGQLLKTFDATRTVVPKSRIRQTAMDTMISDGETLLLTDFGDEWVDLKPDGPHMRKPFKDTSDKRLVVFITPTLIDRAGNRLNRDSAAAAKPATRTTEAQPSHPTE